MYCKMTDGSDSVCNGRVAEYVMEASSNTGRGDENLDWDSSSRKKQIHVKGDGVVDLYWSNLTKLRLYLTIPFPA